GSTALRGTTMRRANPTKTSTSMRIRRKGMRTPQGLRSTSTNQVRNGECGMRNVRGGKGARGLSLRFRTPHSALHICLLLASCTPITTRPPFFPDRRPPEVTLNARPEPVTVGIDSLVRAESLEVAHVNVR